MSDVQGGQAAVVETTTQAAPEAAVSSQEPAQRDWEKEARADGWVPEAEFKGEKRPAKFLTAEEFVRRGEEFEPFIRKSRKELADENKELKESVARMTRVFEQSLDRERERSKKEIEELKASRREAIKAGDVDAVDRLDTQIEAATKTAVPAGDVSYDKMTPEQRQTVDETVMNEWVAKQAWWDTDEDLRDAAVGISNRLARKDRSMAENLKLTEEELRRKFPAKFGIITENKAANGHAAVDGGGSFNGSSGKRAKGESDLTRDEREAGQMLIKKGIYSNLKDYAKDLYAGQ